MITMVGLVSRRGWIGLVGGIGVAVALLAAAGMAWFGPSIERARTEYDRGDWRASASTAARLLERDPQEVQALRLRARSLARLGRPLQAFALDAKLGGERLEAEDLFLVGEALRQGHRPDLGRAAIEAALRLDPKHSGALDAHEASRRGPGAARADRLSAIPGTAALAELIVGLAATGPETPPAADDFDRALDRVLRRDRSTLSKVDSPSAARRLLGRVLLEDGRTAAAADWLGKVDDGADREAQWLLSRAFLVEGDTGRANAAIGRAGDYGQDDSLALEPSRYVGAKRCAGCHREIYQAQQNSHHAATVAWGDGLRGVPLPDRDVVDPENPSVVHRFERSGRQVRLSAEVGGRTIGAEVDYALGSGNHGITMLGREADGRHRSLRISYYARGKNWGLTSGFEAHPDKPQAYIGELLNEESFRNCLNCHTTRFTSERDRAGPEVADRGIGCERCHGPGDHHLRAIEAGFAQPAIARPRLASPARRIKVCAQCHGSDGVIPPADPRFIRFQATTLPYSRCLTESGGRLDCVSCHDPHRDLETSPSYYEARCLACHGGWAPGSAEPGLRLEAVAASRCKVNATEDCVRCHMPKVDNIMPFTSFTDHHIRVHRPVEAADPPQGRP